MEGVVLAVQLPRVVFEETLLGYFFSPLLLANNQRTNSTAPLSNLASNTMDLEKATFIVAVLALFVGVLTLIVAILAIICVTPFLFDGMGWKFPYAQPLPPPTLTPAELARPFAPGSDELNTLQRISNWTEATGMFAIIQNSGDKSLEERSKILDAYHELYKQQ